MPQLIASVQGVEIKHIHLQKDSTTLGRHPDNDIVLDNMVVSGRHCAFDLEGLAKVYLEDLRSTNGTYVNDHMVKSRTLLHDGDIISIGQFRVRFIQESERPNQFGSTMAIQLGTQGTGPAAGAPAAAAAAQPAQALHGSFKLMSGSSAGLDIPLVKAVTTFGKPELCVVSVSHRRTGFFVAYLAGETKPTLNGKPLGLDPVLLADRDILDIGGSAMQFHVQVQG